MKGTDDMGYTHYFTLKKNIPAASWIDIQAACTRILAAAIASGIAIAGPDGTGAPQSTTEHIAFNGDDSLPWQERGTQSYETFWISRKRERDRDGKLDGGAFCKTEYRPYDTACTAICCALETLWPEFFMVSSDGTADEWQAGLALARAALPEKGNQLKIPAWVIYDSMWQRHCERGTRYMLKLHNDGTYRVTIRGQMDEGVAIDMDTVRRAAEGLAKQFSGWHSGAAREKAVDKLLHAAVIRARPAAMDSRAVGQAATLFASIAGDHLASAGGV
jgi:hypothetical protein